MAGILRSYTRLLERYPLRTQMISSGVLVAIGDACAQIIVEKRHKSNYDVMRTLRFFGIGTFYMAPALNVWYRVLERVTIGGPKIYPAVRMVLDQTTFGPCFLSSVLIVLRYTDGYSLNDSIALWKRDFWSVYTTGLMIWPAAQLINFYLVPLNSRILFVQGLSIFWNTYLSYKANQGYAKPVGV